MSLVISGAVRAESLMRPIDRNYGFPPLSGANWIRSDPRRSDSGLQTGMSGLPDVFYAQRIKALVQRGALVSEGNLNYMSYSEVRLP